MRKSTLWLAVAVTAIFAIQHFRRPSFDTDDFHASILQGTDADFRQQVADSGEWVLVDFWAPWCGPCLQLKPTLNELAAVNDQRVQFLAMNVDQTRETANFFGIRGIPALVLLRNGSEVDRWTGPAPAHVLQQWLDGHLQGG